MVTPSLFDATKTAAFRDRVRGFTRREIYTGLDHVERMRIRAERAGDANLAAVYAGRINALWGAIERRDALTLERAS